MGTINVDNIKDNAGGENVHMAGAVLQVVQAIDTTQEANASSGLKTATNTYITHEIFFTLFIITLKISLKKMNSCI